MEANYLSYYLAYHYHVNELINHNWVFPILAIQVLAVRWMRSLNYCCNGPYYASPSL